MNLGTTLALFALFAFMWAVSHQAELNVHKAQDRIAETVVPESIPLPTPKPQIIYKCPPKKWPPTDAMGKPQYWTPKRLK